MPLSATGRKTHKLLINKAGKYFSERGYTIIREAKMSGKTRIDLLAIRGSERVGVECQLTISYDIIRQKFRAYGSSLTKMIFVVPAGRAEKTQKVLERISKEEKIQKTFFDIWSEDVDVTTTIRISKKAKARLDEICKEIGKFGETYDDVLARLVDDYKKHNRKGDK